MQQELINRISIIVPSLDPDEKLNQTINSLINIGFSDIICVNDGSREECLDFFPLSSDTVTLLTHNVNMGKGAALRTAFKHIKDNRPNSIGAITVDGDGQHKAQDVLRCAEELIWGQDKIVLGCRDFSQSHVPNRSRFGNKITSLVFKLLCGMTLSDTQTGLRAFPAKYYQDMIDVEGDRFEYETNMLLKMKAHKIPYSEVKIETVYIEDNKTSHFRPIKDSIRIYSLILKSTFAQFFKFALGSFLSFAIDGVLVFCLLHLFTTIFSLDLEIKNFNAMVATFGAKAIARVFSSFFNFTLNRKIVFPSSMPLRKALIRYYCIVIPVLLFSSILTAVFENIPIFNTAFMIMILGYAIDTILFFFNYSLQKKWVFKNTNNFPRKDQ